MKLLSISNHFLAIFFRNIRLGTIEDVYLESDTLIYIKTDAINGCVSYRIICL
ncbi:hypothetical protein Riv7116_2632 [Rivularia sp. PCC 7116]|nr:hypothetical protein Riv7116_2632 [Rivularia sp. PCC 7116]